MKVAAVERGMPAPDTTPAAVARAPTPIHPAEGPSSFARVLHGLGGAIGSGEALMQRAMGMHSDAGPAELIALQAGVYRYSEAIDLASRLIDHATSDVKTVLQGAGQ